MSISPTASSTFNTHNSDDATASTSSPKEIPIIRSSELGLLSKKIHQALKRKEKEVSHFIESLEQISTRRLEDRHRKIDLRNDIEKARILKERKSIETWDKFVYEIDSRIEDQTIKVSY
jgi:hypothetical protein